MYHRSKANRSGLTTTTLLYSLDGRTAGAQTLANAESSLMAAYVLDVLLRSSARHVAAFQTLQLSANPWAWS